MLKILFIMKETVLKNGSVIVTVVGKERTKKSQYIAILKLIRLFLYWKFATDSDKTALTQSYTVENKIKLAVVVNTMGLTKW